VPTYLLLHFKESLKANAESMKQLVVNNGIEMEEIGVIVSEIIEHTITERTEINTYSQVNYYRELFTSFYQERAHLPARSYGTRFTNSTITAKVLF